MREIKFRAWQPATVVYSDDYDDMQAFWRYNEDLTIEQFTGLLDCNGKEIYEGDIVYLKNFGFAGGMSGGIEWHGSGLVGWCIHDFCKDKHHFLNSKDNIEVIGNIHECAKGKT